MENTPTKVILDVQIDNSEAVENISKLKKQIDKLREAQKKEAEQNSNTSAEYVRLGEQIKNLNKQVQEQSRVIQDEAKAKQLDKDMTIDLNGSYNSLSQQLAKLKAAYHAASTDEDRERILKNLTAVDEKLKDLDAQQGVYTRNVGNYKSALDGYMGNNKYVAGLTKINDAFGASKNVVKDASNAVAGFGKNMMAMLANPIVLGIAAIVLTVQQLTEAFKRNDEAMTAGQKIIAPFKAVWQSVQRLFDDIIKIFVSVFENLNKVSNGFSVFQQAMLPLKVLIAAVRAQFAILGNTLTVITKGVAVLAQGIRDRVQGSVIGKWINNIQTTIRDLFSSVDSFLKKAAGSKIGKMLGLDTLYAQLKDILGTNEELIKTNQQIADLEYNINKKRAENTKLNADEELRISQLRAKAAEKDKVSAEDRIVLLSEAAKLEEGIAARNTALAQMEYDLQVKKNSLTESNAQDKQAEADAYANLINAQKAEFDKKRELVAQIAEARNSIKGETGDIEENTEVIMQNAEELLKLGNELRKKYGLISDDTQLQEELAKLEQALKDGAILREEYETIKQQIREREIAEQQAANDERVRKEQEALEKMRAARVKFGLEEEQSQEQQELTQLETAYADKLLSDEEYEQAKAAIQDKYRQEKEAADQAAYQKELQAAADGIADWGSRVTGAIDAIFGAIDAAENAEMQKYEEDNEAKKAQLEDRLNAGLISQEQYDSAVSNLDAAADKKKKELELQQAKRQKAMAIMNATLNAAAAIIASLAQAPVAIGILPNPVGIASLALATATGAAQIAAAAATPLPKASRGALLRGRSHAQGGIPIEAEGGEAIINKRSTQRYLPLLSAINQAGGGVPLYANGGIPQQVMRSQEQAAFAADDMLAAIANIHPQVAVTDINRGQSAMAVVTARKEY